MKSRVTRLLIMVFCLIGTQWACKPAQEADIQPVNQDITIEEAQSWRTTQQTMARLGVKNAKTALTNIGNWLRRVNFLMAVL